MPHSPPVHVAVPFAGPAHPCPHVPQLFASLVVFTSQPSPATRLQSAKPALHDPIVQLELAHAGVAFGSAAQSCEQLPQLLTSFVRLAHEPPHAVRPALHAMPHSPPVHVALPLPFAGPAHPCPHEPQFATSLDSFTHAPPQLV
jgi:hypothetical protein